MPHAPDYDSILGNGCAYPIDFDVSAGTVKRKAGLSHIAQSIFLLLTIPKGAVVMKPWLGSNLFLYIDNPINRATIAAIRLEIYNALLEETRGEVKKIIIENPEIQQLKITVYFLVEHEVTIAVELLYLRDEARWVVIS
jgi:phage baseplate assembly protein W